MSFIRLVGFLSFVWSVLFKKVPLYSLLHSGENAIVIVSGANQMLQPDEVGRARDVVAKAKVVVCQLEIAPNTTLAALKMAKNLGGNSSALTV